MTTRTVRIAVAAGAAALVALLVVGWAVDAAASSGEIRRHVRIAGREVGGLDAAGLGAVMDELDAAVASTPVEITTPDRVLGATLGSLGVTLDRDATRAAAFDAGRSGFVLFAPVRWIGSFVGHVDAPVALDLDRDASIAAVAELAAPLRIEAKEPSLAFIDGELTTVAGQSGVELDAAAVVDALERLDGRRIDGSRVTIEGTLVFPAPRQADTVATGLLGRIETALDRTITVELGDDRRTLDATELAPFLGARLGDDDRLVIDLDDVRTLEWLADTFDDVGTDAAEPDIAVVGGKLSVSAGKPGTKCCAPDAVAALERALERNESRVRLALTERKPDKDASYFAKLGIVELVASFTTQHPCCAPRVDNIHRMADIVGARVIEPGKTFSLNGAVGRRTTANGFKAAPTIDGNGNFVDDVGGGVSQFSTTLFNAAFFAGLEIDEYMAHGLYISRYPYGREATLSFPGPDLKIRNDTPYGVLIWPTYTDTSITISLFSTKHITATQSSQTETQYGAVCTAVTTYRTRTWTATGKTAVDSFYALYGPAEGVQCDGTTIPKDGATTTTSSTTTVPGGSTTTTAPTTPTTAPPTTTPPGTTTSTAKP